MIFLPGEKAEWPQRSLRHFGLADHIPGCESIDSVGPENQTGVLCFWRQNIGDETERFEFEPDNQTWVCGLGDGEFTGSRRYFVGFANDAPPTPSEIRQTYPSVGNIRTLGDGNEWLIPTPNKLPIDMRLTERDRWVDEEQRRLADYIAAAEAWQRFLLDLENPTELNWADVSRFLNRAIRINYRTTPEVVSRLNLFTENNMVSILFAACGIEPLPPQITTEG